jgi:hypothetical protein
MNAHTSSIAIGQPVVAVNPNLAISSPGRISASVNQQTSFAGGNT